jgi:hypothetical protein
MKGGSTALLHSVATCCLSHAASAGTAEAATGLECRSWGTGRRDLQASRTAGVQTAVRVRPPLGPRARCGRGFALMYASRRRRGFPRDAPRRQGTGPCRSTRQIWMRGWDGLTGGTRPRDASASGTASSVRTARTLRRCATTRERSTASRCPETSSTSCQRWKRTGTSPSHPSASPLNRNVSQLKELHLWEAVESVVPPEKSFCFAPGASPGMQDRSESVGRTMTSSGLLPDAFWVTPARTCQVADCGRLRGASIHRAK